MSKIKHVHTIGYQGKKITQFILELKENHIVVLVDARSHTGGRKLEFCKKNLTKSLNENGIKYVHYRELGTPEYLMKVMKEKGTYSMDEYALHLDSQPEVLTRVVDEIQDESVAIMCFEKDYKECHRSVVADRISKLVGTNVKHI